MSNNIDNATTHAKHNSSRRLFLGITGATIIAFPAVATPTDPDSGLVAMANEIVALDQEYGRLTLIADGMPPDEDDRFTEAHIWPLLDHIRELRIAMVSVPAHGLPGFRAKAIVARLHTGFRDEPIDPEREGALTWSLAGDLLGARTKWKTIDAEPADATT